MRQYHLPEALNQQIQIALSEYGQISSKKMADCILKLSDFYNQRGGETPYDQEWARLAYLAYFLPLNFIRNLAVVDEGIRVGFFNGMQRWTDYGSGLGAATLALREHFKQQEFELIDRSRWAVDNARKYFSIQSNPARINKSDTWVFSYAVNEFKTLPEAAIQARRLMIVEPSTRELGRNLLEMRNHLQGQGFFAWAPCTHNGACPLLKDSKRDWCHSRVQFKAPDWFKEIESYLPMKNADLTFSFLLLSREIPEKIEIGRLVGDMQIEKGKSKIMLCRSEKREFMSFLDRHWKTTPDLYRDEMVQVEKPSSHSEIRIESELDFKKVK